ARDLHGEDRRGTRAERPISAAAARPTDRRVRAGTSRPRLLFVAEAVTLAHAGRMMALASALAEDHEVFFACDPRFDSLLGETAFERRRIATIPSERFLTALAKGVPIYDTETLAAYVEEDRALIAKVAPDAVIGDFRLSLDVSATLTSTPYLNVTNAYW